MLIGTQRNKGRILESYSRAIAQSPYHFSLNETDLSPGREFHRKNFCTQQIWVNPTPSPHSPCFDVEGTSGRIGGPDLENAISVKSKLFGSTQVGFFRSTNLSSDWLTLSPSSGPFYRLYSRAWKPDGCTSKITPQEAVKIIESLGWLP